MQLQFEQFQKHKLPEADGTVATTLGSSQCKKNIPNRAGSKYSFRAQNKMNLTVHTVSVQG